MFTLTVSLDSLSLYIVAVDILILLTYVLYIYQKKRNLEKAIQKITVFITDYFMHTGAEVQVSCFKVDGNKRFVTLIESQPLKRFRYSNVLESNIISHIYKITGYIVEKIYWRFPVQVQRESYPQEEKYIKASEDTYFADIHTLTNTDGEYKVSEVSWDEFVNAKKKS